MAVTAANWLRPVCAAFASPAVQKLDSEASHSKFSSSLSLQPIDSSRRVQRSGASGNRRRWKLENRAAGRLRVNVVKASADDADKFDDEAVVRDMERYLNELSVEYENVWDTKPAWCQPWSIVLTGVAGVSLSWLAVKSTIVTGIVTVLVAGWWYVFLYTYPLAYTAMIAERRKNQRNGTEDTYGLRRSKE